MKIFKRILIFLGNLLPPPLNKYFYFFGGVKFKNINKVWIGQGCFFDNYDPSLIFIDENVCIAFKVILITHYDPTNSIPNPKIKKYSKNIVIKKNCFIGAGAIILPGVILNEGSFLNAGSVLRNSFPKNSMISGNPAKKIFEIK